MDVETNGLIKGAVYPRIVQFSWGALQHEGRANRIERLYY